MNNVVNLYKGDCLTEHERIESGSVDLILTDLPYGNMNTDGGRKLGIDGWDMAIEPAKVFAVANRILRKNGKLVLFSQESYTSRLINEAIPNLPFNYRMIWEKDHFTNSLIAKKAPVSYFEDILVFSKAHDTDGLHPLRKYAWKVREFIGYSRTRLRRDLGHYRFLHFLESNSESSQFSLCTEDTYDELIEVYAINNMEGFKTFEELREIDRSYDAVFNLPPDKRYKSNILRYKKDYDGYHPTQKPIALLEDLIYTYSNEGDHVVDLTIGSGSTGVAAANLGRRFTGTELDENYFEIAERRIGESKANKAQEVMSNE